VAGALAESSVHISRSGLLLVAAGAFALLALTARGPLGVARWCGPRLHAALDIAVALVVAAAPLVPALRPHWTGIVVVEVTAVAWVRVATLTRYTRPASHPGAGTSPAGTSPGGPSLAGASPSGASPTGVPAPGDRSGPVPTSAVVGRGLGILAGRSARRLPDAEERLRGGARQAGRHLSGLQRTWRKGPAVPDDEPTT
jgi:hypothetical protein